MKVFRLSSGKFNLFKYQPRTNAQQVPYLSPTDTLKGKICFSSYYRNNNSSIRPLFQKACQELAWLVLCSPAFLPTWPLVTAKPSRFPHGCYQSPVCTLSKDSTCWYRTVRMLPRQGCHDTFYVQKRSSSLLKKSLTTAARKNLNRPLTGRNLE